MCDLSASKSDELSERRTIASPSMSALSTGSAATTSRIRVKALA
jgi:hypothetical protein